MLHKFEVASEDQNDTVWFRDSHWALQGGSLVLMLSWTFWSLLNTIYIHGKPHGCLQHPDMHSSTRLIGILLYQFSLITKAEKADYISSHAFYMVHGIKDFILWK